MTHWSLEKGDCDCIIEVSNLVELRFTINIVKNFLRLFKLAAETLRRQDMIYILFMKIMHWRSFMCR